MYTPVGCVAIWHEVITPFLPPEPPGLFRWRGLSARRRNKSCVSIASPSPHPRALASSAKRARRLWGQGWTSNCVWLALFYILFFIIFIEHSMCASAPGVNIWELRGCYVNYLHKGPGSHKLWNSPKLPPVFASAGYVLSIHTIFCFLSNDPCLPIRTKRYCWTPN